MRGERSSRGITAVGHCIGAMVYPRPGGVFAQALRPVGVYGSTSTDPAKNTGLGARQNGSFT
jgi:hypothetical protein